MQTINPPKVQCIDLEFVGIKGVISAYLIPHSYGIALIECGPASTIDKLKNALNLHGYTFSDVSDVFLTHIHLDHAGAAGYLVKHGARIHVHHVGASHLEKPGKLLSSAKRIYGDLMEKLWGKFLPAPPDQINTLHDGDSVVIGDCQIRAVETTGHANHHMAYIFRDICFSGDIGGVRLEGHKHIRLPLPPPELHIEKWLKSIKRLQYEPINLIAPTHFGFFQDPHWHLNQVEKILDQIDIWMETTMPDGPSDEKLNSLFKTWLQNQSRDKHLDQEQINAYEIVNPSWMSIAGIKRYWRKYRQG